MQILHLTSLFLLPYIPPPIFLLKSLKNEYILPQFLFSPQLPVTANFPSGKQNNGRKDNTGINPPQAVPLLPKPSFLPCLFFQDCELLTNSSHEDRKFLTIERLHKIMMEKNAGQPNKNTIKKKMALLQITPKEILEFRSYLLLNSTLLLWPTIITIRNFLLNPFQLTALRNHWIRLKNNTLRHKIKTPSRLKKKHQKTIQKHMHRTNLLK